MITITVSERALGRVRELLTDIGDDGYGLRVGVRSFGWAAQYRLSLAPGPARDEVTIHIGELRAFASTNSAHLIDGIHIDYLETGNSAGFTFHNPGRTACDPPPALLQQPAPPLPVAPQGGARYEAAGGPTDAPWQQIDETNCAGWSPASPACGWCPSR